MRYLIAILLRVLLLTGCIESENDSFVGLDGPILESVNKDGQLEFNGVVLNSGELPVESVFVVIILKDESGNIIEANSTPLFEDGNDLILYPQQREFFTLSLDSDSDKVFSKEVEIYYDVFDDTTLDVDESQGDELDLEFN